VEKLVDPPPERELEDRLLEERERESRESSESLSSSESSRRELVRFERELEDRDDDIDSNGNCANWKNVTSRTCCFRRRRPSGRAPVRRQGSALPGPLRSAASVAKHSGASFRFYANRGALVAQSGSSAGLDGLALFQAQEAAQLAAGMGFFAFRHVQGVPSATMRPPSSPPSGPKVDHPVGMRDEVGVMLDDEDRMAPRDEPV
jgi:hypothetical protein